MTEADRALTHASVTLDSIARIARPRRSTSRGRISRTLIDLTVVRELQRSVMDTIAEVDPSVARQIVARLKEWRALRASGTPPALDGGFDVA